MFFLPLFFFFFAQNVKPQSPVCRRLIKFKQDNHNKKEKETSKSEVILSLKLSKIEKGK